MPKTTVVKPVEVKMVPCPQCKGKGTCTLCSDTGEVDELTAKLNSK